MEVATTKTAYDIFHTMEYDMISNNSALVQAWSSVEKLGPFVNGAWSTTEVTDGVVEATATDVHAAVGAAAAALKGWNALGGPGRARVLYSVLHELERHTALLGQVGSPRDVAPTLQYCSYYAGWAQLLDTELPGWRPHGVTAVLTSRATGLATLALLVAPALAGGNTVVIKPSRHSPMPALLLAHICFTAGLPSGVLNVVPGGPEVGILLCQTAEVAHVTFCGRSGIGRQIRTTVAGAKTTSMLLAGTTSMIVFDSADLDSAVDSVADYGWRQWGQVPGTLGSLLVQESVFDSFVARLRVAFSRVVSSAGLWSEEAAAEVQLRVDQARRNGNEVMQAPCPPRWAPPTVLIGVPAPVSVLADPPLLPIVTVQPFRTAREAVMLANNTRHGLGAAVWTQQVELALEVAAGLQVGSVWVNSLGTFDSSVPIEGWKESGIGCFGGKEGLLDAMLAPDVDVDHDLTYSLDQLLSLSASSLLLPAAPPANTYQLFWGGAFHMPEGGSWIDLQPGVKVPSASVRDMDNAIQAAAKFQPAWGRRGASQRASVLRNLAEKLRTGSDRYISHLVTVCCQNPDVAARELEDAVTCMLYWAAACDKPVLGGGVQAGAQLRREPRGVVVVVDTVPTRPLMAPLSLLVPAIAQGNSVVLVASPTTCPAIMMMCQDVVTLPVPFPLMVLVGHLAALGPALSQHPTVNAIWSTGILPAEWAHRSKADIRESVNGPREKLELRGSRSKALWLAAGDTLG